ncbi:MFS transporter [Nocardioides sp. KR10-350]|uniref:MFS transporter n=1 Tax=Nocardioides cheoyonin TaxID=3156615 RepID=UPI0032B47105
MTTTVAVSESRPVEASDRSELRRVILSSYLGSTIEMYDFILYATASTVVFGPVFFADLDPLWGTVASYALFAIGYIARPLGGVVFGHFGDLVGRKRMLLIAMLVMGLASFAVGLVPAVPTWGALALVVLRAVQGIAIGGEWGGAALMSLEHSPTRSRGLAASFANAGGPAGAFLGTVALALVALLPKDEFLSWGWRVPFLASIVLLAVGLWVRSSISESPVFQAAMERQEELEAERATRKLPIAEVLRRPGTLVAVAIVGMGAFVIQALFSTMGITIAVTNGVSESQGLWAFAISQAVAAFTIPVSAAISDRVGRRPVMLTGLLATAALGFPVFHLMSSGSWPQVILGFLLACPVLQSLTYGPLAAFLTENFSTTSRYTGASLGYQLASLLGAGFTPLITSSIFAAQHGTYAGVGLFLVGGVLVSAVVLAVAARETRGRDLVADVA